jgi:hypothetical protein
MVDVPTPGLPEVLPAEVPDVELYHAKTYWTKYVFSQDAKSSRSSIPAPRLPSGWWHLCSRG